jgi:peptide/nickel transport system substrate-binding protein
MKKRRLLQGTVLVLLAVGCMTLSEVQAKPEGTMKQGIHFNISADWLDPATAGTSISPLLPMYLFHDALFKAMPDGTYSPCLAESWTISPDTKVYEFKLRKGVKFHNGDTLSAEDVVFSFSRYKAAQAKFIQSKIEKIEAPNPYLVRIQFKESFPDFLEYLIPGATTIGWIVPKKYVEKVGDAGFKKQPVGCGPYRFVEFIPGVRLVGEAFEEYWRKVPHIKRMEFFSLSDPATRLAMVKRGEVDVASQLQGVFWEDAQRDTGIRASRIISPTRWLLYFSNQWDPKSPCSNPKIRKAMSLAIDRQTLADVHMPGGEGIGSLGLPGDPHGADFPADPYDPKKARELLAEAGYPKGLNAGTFYPHEGGYWPYGEQVANYWKAVGITVDTVLLDRPAWFAYRQGGKMQNAIFIDLSNAPTISGRLAYLFGASSYGNYPDIRKVWDQYGKTIDPKERKELILQVQKMVYDRMMFIPLTSTKSNSALSFRVKGNPYKVQPLIWFTAPFEDIELEK